MRRARAGALLEVGAEEVRPQMVAAVPFKPMQPHSHTCTQCPCLQMLMLMLPAAARPRLLGPDLHIVRSQQPAMGHRHCPAQPSERLQEVHG